MAAQNWCDQYVRNGGTIETACDYIMDDPTNSFAWSATTEGQYVWEGRYNYLMENGQRRKQSILCR